MSTITTPPPLEPTADPTLTANPRTPGTAWRLLAEAGEFVSFSGRALRALPGVPRFTAEALRQASILVRGTTLFLAVMAGFYGFSVTSFGYFFLRTVGASDYVGINAGLVGARLAAVAMFAYVFSSKVACGIVAEIGAAKISEEIDGYKVEAVDPYKYIIGTRLAAAIMYIPIAAAVSLTGFIFFGYLNAVLILDGVTAQQYYSAAWSVIGMEDLFYMFSQIAVVGLMIVLVACFYGYRCTGGPEAVGEAVARSLIVNLTLCQVIPAIFVMSFYNIENPNLNIGG